MRRPTGTSIRIVLQLALALAVPFAVFHYARVRKAEYKARLDQQMAQFAALSAENKKLLSPEFDTCALTPDKFKELLRLRGEMRDLREKANEAARMRLIAEHPTNLPTNNPTQFWRKMPDPETIQAFWPKEQLRFAGYSDPLNAVQSSLWIFTQNNPDLLASYLDAETRSNLIKGASMDGGTPAERIAWQSKSVVESITPSTAFYVGNEISSRIPDLNPDLHILPVYFANEAVSRLFALKKFDEEWKLQAVYQLTGTENAPSLGTPLWP